MLPGKLIDIIVTYLKIFIVLVSFLCKAGSYLSCSKLLSSRSIDVRFWNVLFWRLRQKITEYRGSLGKQSD